MTEADGEQSDSYRRIAGVKADKSPIKNWQNKEENGT